MTTLPVLPGSDRGAVVTTSGVHRYRLWRRWGPGDVVCFVMLNPSTADADLDDPTIRKCIGFGRRWGFGAIDVVNLYAYRATEPADLRRALRDPVVDVYGRDNRDHVADAATKAARVVAAWGADPAAPHAARLLTDNGGPLSRVDLWAIGVTSSGAPRHPLMAPYGDAVLWRARRLGLLPSEETGRPTPWTDTPGGGVCRCLHPDGPVCDDCPEEVSDAGE